MVQQRTSARTRCLPDAQRHISPALSFAPRRSREFLQTKFAAEALLRVASLIPLLDHLKANSARTGIHEVLSHRGRLNVLANTRVLRADLSTSSEWHHMPNSVQGSGDVKYHLGTGGPQTTAWPPPMAANPYPDADGVLISGAPA